MMRILIPWMAALAAACSPKPEVWVQSAYFSGFDPISETHISRTLKNLGIEWRPGKEGWRGYYIDIRERDLARATSALETDEKAGNINGLVGIDSPEPRQESIRRPAAEFLKSERFAEGTLERRVIRHPEFAKALKNFPNVDTFAIRARSYLDQDNQRRKGIEGRIELVADLDRKVAGQRLDFKVYKDGEFVEVHTGGAWWQGTPEEIERNRIKYGIER